MITGTHAIIYAGDAERARAFFRDVLGVPGGGEIGLYQPRHRTAYDL